MKLRSSQINSFIISGGKSTRMGKDKGMLVYRGNTFISHIASELKAVFKDVFIVSNHFEHKSSGFPVIHDLINNIGPLGGIYTALKYSNTDYNFIVACDSPLVDGNVLREFFKRCNTCQLQYAVVDEKIHPLFAIYHKSLANQIEKSIIERDFKLTSLIQKVNSCPIPFNEFYNNLLNVNTPEVYLQLTQINADEN